MIISLLDTNSSAISSALLRARRSAGSPTMGMVLTLIIVSDSDGYAEALEASSEAGREHPCRILLVVTGSGRGDQLDAEVRIGEGGTPGEVVVIKMSGAQARHPASVIRPLLLPDSPVVTWWPGRCPSDPGSDELAVLAGRRITDAAAARQPRRQLVALAGHYADGDTDLTWTRLTPWRALLAAALDQYPARITGVQVEAERNNPSADLLSAWLGSRLKLTVRRGNSQGPGITAVRLSTAAGDIAITRPDGLLASYAVPGQPNRLVALKRRDTSELVTEELRRMDQDPVFAGVLNAFAKQQGQAAPRRTARAGATAKPSTPTPTRARAAAHKAAKATAEAALAPAGTAGKKTATKKTAAKKATGTKTASKKTASKKTAAKKTATTKTATTKTATTKTATGSN